MNVSPLHSTLIPPQRPSQPKTLTKHEPSLLRDVVEKGVGAVSGLMKVPGSLISGIAVGGYQGARKGGDQDYQITPESVAKGLVISNATQSLAQGAITGYLLLGPVGAVLNAAKEGGQSAFGLYLFIKGGSAKEMGSRMAAAIDAKVDGGQGAVKGAAEGVLAGTVSAVKSGTVTGYHEGRGAASGVIEGLREIPKEFGQAEGLRGNAWRQALSIAAGVVSAIISTPVGLAFSLLKGEDPSTELSGAKRYTTAAASGALMGALAGSFAGPLGMAIGAGVGAIVGAAGPASRKSFDSNVGQSLTRAQSDNTDLGHEIANRRRDLVEKVMVGTVAGARHGWDAGVGSLEQRVTEFPAR